MTAEPDASLGGRVRDGRWRTVDPGHLGWLALAAALADVVTTWQVLTDPTRREGNRVLAPAAEVDPLFAMGLLVLWTGALVGCCWLDLGWPSTVVGWFTVVVHGVSGGVNNLVAERTGFFLNQTMGGVLAMELLFPTLGVLVGLTAARRRYDRLPRHEVGALLGFAPLVVVRLVVL